MVELEQEIVQEEAALESGETLCRETLGLNSPENREYRAERLDIPPESEAATEHLAIITNSRTEFEVARILAEAAKNLGAKVEILHYRDFENEERNFDELEAAVETLGVKLTVIDYPEDNDDKQKEAINLFASGDIDVAVRLATDHVSLTDEFEAIAVERGLSMPEMPGLTVDSLASGVFKESPPLMEKREQELLRILSQTSKFHLVSGNGTNLWIEVDPSEKWQSDPANFSRRGQHAPVDNLPGREVYKNTLATKTEGALVLNYLDSYVTKEKVIVDEPVILRFHEGRIVSIEGGNSAEMLKAYLRETSRNDEDPSAAYRLTEVALGLNYLARSYESGEVPTLEAEKAPRMHVAIGDSPVRGEGVANQANIVSSDVHLDFVLPRIHVVEAELTDGSKFTIFGAAGSLERYGKRS